MTKIRQYQRCASAINRLETSFTLAILGTIFLTAAIMTPPARAQTFTTLHSFNVTDGANPSAGLILMR